MYLNHTKIYYPVEYILNHEQQTWGFIMSNRYIPNKVVGNTMLKTITREDHIALSGTVIWTTQEYFDANISTNLIKFPINDVYAVLSEGADEFIYRTIKYFSRKHNDFFTITQG